MDLNLRSSKSLQQRARARIIVGNSAGALALSKTYVATGEQGGEPKVEAAPGLGLVDFGITVHYKGPSTTYSVRSFDEVLKSLSERLKTGIYAIPERHALVWSDGSLNFVGDVYLFLQGEKTKCRVV